MVNEAGFRHERRQVTRVRRAARELGQRPLTLAVLAVVMGVVALTACSSPTTQGQPKGEATSAEQPSTEQPAPSADQSPVSTT